MMDKVIGISIGGVVLAITAPIALDQIAGTNTSAWDSSVGTIFDTLLPIILVIGLVLIVYKTA